MCAVTSIVDRSVRSIESIDGRYGGCWRRSSPKPPSHKPRRRLNSSSTPGPVDCARAVWRETLSWVPFGAAPPQVTRPPPPDNPLQTAPSLIARYDDARESPLTRARCGGGGARSLDRARGVWRLRWRWRAVTSPVTRVTRAARHACVRVRRHRASRASSPFPSPPCRTGTRALLRRRRLLARARGGGGGGVGGGVQLHRASRASRARVHVITAHRVRHHRSSSPTRPHACAATAAALARSIARAVCGGCGGGGGRWRGRAVTSPVTRVTRAAHHARVCVRHHRASRASSPFSVPPAHDRHAARAAAAAALARSLARAEAEAVGLGVAFSYTARHARHARARERHHRASRASSPFFVPPVHDRHARAAAAAALARSLDCARAVWRW